MNEPELEDLIIISLQIDILDIFFRQFCHNFVLLWSQINSLMADKLRKITST